MILIKTCLSLLSPTGRLVRVKEVLFVLVLKKGHTPQYLINILN